MTPPKTRQRVVLLATDRSNSIIGEIVEGNANVIAYSVYGAQSAQQDVETLLAFNAQLREANIGWYLLGNGYRAYNPRLMRFHSPDSWSPFGMGGLNAYMYCMGDPLNRSDKSGHAPLFPGLPLGLRKFVSRVDRFFFGGSSVTGANRSKAITATAGVESVTGPMRSEPDNMFRTFDTLGTYVAGAPGPRGNNSPAIQYVETSAKHHPGYVAGATQDRSNSIGGRYATHVGGRSGGQIAHQGGAHRSSFDAPRTLYDGPSTSNPVLVNERLLGGSPSSGPVQPPPPPPLPPPPPSPPSSSASSSPPTSRDSTPPTSRRNSGDRNNAPSSSNSGSWLKFIRRAN